MSPTLDSFLRSWPSAPWLLVSLILTAGIYLRGWRCLRRGDPRRWHAGQPSAFLGGLAALYLALASPLETFAGLLLQAHMGQHLLLMMVAPPLLWLGEPLFPLLRGLPASIRAVWFVPLFQSPVLQRIFEGLTHPFLALALFIGVTWTWHAPALYERALKSEFWHYVQHVSFFGAALLFWFAVVRPYPSRPSWSPWLLLPCLLLADVSNTVLSALLTFSDRMLYPHYDAVPRIGGLSALTDQSAAGLLMWVPGSIAYLGPLFYLGVQLLSGATGKELRPASRRRDTAGRLALPLVVETRPRRDGVNVPILGRLLRWQHARLAAQLPLLLLAAVVIWDGLRGPDAAPMNLAGVLPWIHWRGIVILGLLAVGNIFCFACPFLLPRTLARRFRPATRSWPRRLRSKWLAVALLAVFLWSYEAFALWDSPWWTAWIAVGYFLLALGIDSIFRGASFCKYVCPIGQFNFIQSLASPFEVAVRDPAVCDRCRTKDCIRGRDGIPGCEMNLFVPRKASNMDCTFCLDCIHACPHDNVGVTATVPGRELWTDSQRSGVGRFSQRPDLAALAALLVFGAFVNAAGMVGPVVDWMEGVGPRLGLRTPLAQTTSFYGLALFVLPAALVGGAASASRRLGRLPVPSREVAVRFSYTLIPLGFGMWIAHYSFHFLTSYDVLVPAAQRFAGDLGCTVLGNPEWVATCCRTAGEALLRCEILALDLGLLLSLYAAWRVARSSTESAAAGTWAWMPWAVLLTGLFALGVWLVFQPMQMRGTLAMVG
jgi:cytochrome c oxidase assembly factor CtaG/polyferredoxin